MFRKNLTPAECQLLKNLYQPLTGSNPITQLEIIKDGEGVPARAAVVVSRDSKDPTKVKMRVRTNSDEMRRLRGKYQETKLEKYFPGMNPSLPETFEECGFEEGLQWQQPEKNANSKQESIRPSGPGTYDDFVFMDAPDDFKVPVEA